jgi:uncharacterized membrane protein
MEPPPTPSAANVRLRPGRWGLAVTACVLVLGLAALPPFVGAEGQAVLRAAFRFVCHQQPARSFAVGGVPFAVCHRCTGVLAGLLAGAVLLPLVVRGGRGRFPFEGSRAGRWLLAALIPLGVDWALGATGIWANPPWSRTLTGAVFGLVAGIVFARAVALPGEVARGVAH